MDWQALQAELLDFLLNGKSDESVQQARTVLEQGGSPVAYFQECITPVLREIGSRFERLEVFLPEMALAGKIVQRMSEEVLKPALETSADRQPPAGKVLLATVKGDLHDIGKTMVGLMLRVNGFEVTDLGINVDPMTIIENAKSWGADIIGMSALLTTTLPYMKDTVDYLNGMNLRAQYLVVVGGAACSAEYAERIGADGYGLNASEAVQLCKHLLDERRA